MELAGDVTRQDIKDIVESHLGSEFWNEANRLGVDVDVRILGDLRPEIEVNTNNDSIRVRITTVELSNDDDEVIGWGFNPHVINAGIHYNFAEDDNPVAEYRQWYNIAKLAQKLYECEIYPMDYLD